MPKLIEEAIYEPIIWVVEGPNWIVELEDQEIYADDGLSPEDIIIDVASRGLLVYDGINKNDTFKILDGNTPKLGLVVSVCMKGEENEPFIIPSSICLVNNGKYLEALEKEKQSKKLEKQEKKTKETN